MSRWPTEKISDHEGKGNNAALFDSGSADLRCLFYLAWICAFRLLGSIFEVFIKIQSRNFIRNLLYF